MRRLIILAPIIVLLSCSSSKTSIFAKRTAHEKYSEALKDAGLEQSELARKWIAAGNKALLQSQVISLPYKETGYFAAERPSAAGYMFSAKRGEKISVDLTDLPLAKPLYFAELWLIETNGQRSYVSAIDTINNLLSYTLTRDAQLVFRIQPELLRSMKYTLTINAGPSLAFPVDKSGNPKIISLWGVARDGGARSHEGIDISARRGTPALASADGTISRVNENNLGGKVVFLRDAETGNNIYYAHLDSQLVSAGQRVKSGDVIGTVGNTGNAKTTVPHLHYGIYSTGGAIDPLAFVDNRRPAPKTVTAPIAVLNTWQRVISSSNMYSTPLTKSAVIAKIPSSTPLMLLAAVESWFKIMLPDNTTGYVQSAILSSKLLQTTNANINLEMMDTPASGSNSKATILKGEQYEITGKYNGYLLVQHNGLSGWIKEQL